MYNSAYLGRTARCPALILFELEEHPHKKDIASFLENELDQYSPETIGN